MFESYIKSVRKYFVLKQKVVETKNDVDDPITDEIEMSLWGLKQSFDLDTEEIQIAVDNYKDNNERRK
tara:strand:- start:355 stop:558 length:204 start_codon:yes stop_codon:yes gene_type:complete